MNPFTRLKNAGRALFGYDFVNPKGRRRAPTGVLCAEDEELTSTDRRKALSAARDIHRNFAVAQWAVRKHLDYVSTFSFQAKTASKDLNQQIERLMREWSGKDRCDAAGRHSLARLVRLMESRRTIDGDVFLLRLANGQLQPIEGDRVRTPLGGLNSGLDVNPADLVHGVQTDAMGRAIAYAVSKRGRSSDFAPKGGLFTFERLVPAVNCYQHAWYERFDQVRGISPMAPAFDTLQDLYEGLGYALGKMKVAQLFGLVIYRAAMSEGDQIGTTTAQEDGEGYKVDFGRGPMFLNLDPGDRAEFLENNTPSMEFQSFVQVLISIALKALDIPFSFFQENFTNYSGARQALLQYQLSCELKRADVLDLLNWITSWRLMLWMEEGLLPTVDAAELGWEWIAKGIPWIDPLKEVQADIAAIGAGLQTRTRALKEQGLDFHEVIDELASEVEYMKERGLDPSINANANIVTLEQAA